MVLRLWTWDLRCAFPILPLLLIATGQCHSCVFDGVWGGEEEIIGSAMIPEEPDSRLTHKRNSYVLITAKKKKNPDRYLWGSSAKRKAQLVPTQAPVYSPGCALLFQHDFIFRNIWVVYPCPNIRNEEQRHRKYPVAITVEIDALINVQYQGLS